jgi:membrane protease YdiL (CAAX protease family)
VENSSPSATLQRSQTLFPPNAFNPWVTIAVLIAALVIVFMIIIAAGVIALASNVTTPAGIARWFNGLPGIQIQMTGEVAAAAFVLAVLPHLAKMPMRDLGFRALTLSDAGYIAAATIAMVVATNGTASLLQTALHTKVSEQAVSLYLSMKTPLAKAQFALLGVVVAAVFEETIFRLVIFNAVRKWAGFWPGAIVSGLLFGLAHLQSRSLTQGLVLAVPLGLGGIVLCAAYFKSRNAYVPIVTHGIFNAITLAVLFFAPQLAK